MLELPKCLANRSPTEAHILGNVTFNDTGAIAQLTRQDLFSEPAGYLLAEPGVGNRSAGTAANHWLRLLRSHRKHPEQRDVSRLQYHPLNPTEVMVNSQPFTRQLAARCLARLRRAYRTVAPPSHRGCNRSESGHDEQTPASQGLSVPREQQAKFKALPRGNRSENWLGVGGDILAMDVLLMVRADPDSEGIEPD